MAYPTMQPPAYVTAAYGGGQYYPVQQPWTANQVQQQPFAPLAGYAPPQPAPTQNFEAPATNGQQKQKVSPGQDILQQYWTANQVQPQPFDLVAGFAPPKLAPSQKSEAPATNGQQKQTASPGQNILQQYWTANQVQQPPFAAMTGYLPTQPAPAQKFEAPTTNGQEKKIGSLETVVNQQALKANQVQQQAFAPVAGYAPPQLTPVQKFEASAANQKQKQTATLQQDNLQQYWTANQVQQHPFAPLATYVPPQPVPAQKFKAPAMNGQQKKTGSLEGDPNQQALKANQVQQQPCTPVPGYEPPKPAPAQKFKALATNGQEKKTGSLKADLKQQDLKEKQVQKRPCTPVVGYEPPQSAPVQKFEAPVTNSQQKKIASLQEDLEGTKETLAREREDSGVKLKKQSKKIKDLEAKERFRKKEIKELKEAKALAEDMWKKTCEEKDALSAMMKSMEKEGCKMARLLKAKEDSLSKAENKATALELDNKVLKKEKLEVDEEVARLKAECEKLLDQMEVKESTAERISTLEDEVACYRSAYEKTALQLKRMSKESEERKQEIEKICVEADEEKATLSKKLKSLSLKCSRKDKVIESGKAAHDDLQKIVENEKAIQNELKKENNTVKSELKKLQNEVESLSQQNHFLQEENYYLRKYSGIKGRFRRVRHFFRRVSDRFSS
ncbi:calponin homology domain-containing protein DDB_G0272472-like isoform X2 [Acropora muricata]